MFRILHLSDIHIGKTYKDPESIACKIASDIDHNGLSNINCIVVTGDIFDGKADVSDSLINSAVYFFEILIEEINSYQEKETINKEDLIFVPGNHDLIRVDNPKDRWNKYNLFLNKFYGCIPDFYDKKNYSLFKDYKDYRIAFVGFNSCEIEKKNLFDEKYINKFEKYIEKSKLDAIGVDKSKIVNILKEEKASEYNDYGNISLSQINPIERKVKKLDDYTVVALFHHHFYLFPEVAQQFGDSSLIRNYTEVIQHLKYMNVSVVLHGHKHFALERPFITDDYYESPNNIIDVFAGGSVGTERTGEHTFGVLDLYDKKNDIKLMHNKFVYHGENLEPIVKKQIPPQKLTGRVVKLLEILKTLSPEQTQIYEEAFDKSFESLDICNKIISWVSEAITGFTEVYKYLDNDYNNILFLLYAVNYRTIWYMNMVGKKVSYFESASKSWNDFYDRSLSLACFAISKEKYNELFTLKKLKDVASHCDQLLNSCDNKKSQVYLAFTMLGIFFSDLYLILTKYADDFKESIKYKVNIKIEENKFHENVPATRIVVKSDVDRRSVYIDLLCNDATAHKMAVLFIKEFDLLINKFEDYFKIIGLKLYYLIPRIDKNKMKNTLDNYNFEAYIPTLIPLLTGDNIYSSKVVFARELIQNSIDAISVREAKDKNDFSKKIMIELNSDKNGKRYFKIIDNGTGMDRYKIERYFTSIGRSFYSSEEYEDLNISYKPISNFGIGFLSSFMVCKEIDVKTKYYLEDSEGLKLHIPNYDGCFFIELDNETNIGTELKLYLDDIINNSDIIGNNKIVLYIQKIMQDIKYDIDIQYLNDKKEKKQINIPAHSTRKQSELQNFKFFVPFLENGDILSVDYSEDILSNNFINQYDYGLLIYKNKKLDNQVNHLVLNSGIVIEQTLLESILFGSSRKSDYIYSPFMRKGEYINIIINFPANWLQLDVARENITGFSNDKRPYQIYSKIASNLYIQILQYIEYSKNNTTNVLAIYLQDLINFVLYICKANKIDNELQRKLNSLKYIIKIEFLEDGLRYKIARNEISNKPIQIIYFNEKARKMRNKLIGILYDHNKLKHFNHQDINYSSILKNDDMLHKNKMTFNDKLIHDLKYFINEVNVNLKMENDEKDIFKLFTLFIFNKSDEIIYDELNDTSHLDLLLEKVFLQYFFVGEEEKKELHLFYDELFEIDGNDKKKVL